MNLYDNTICDLCEDGRFFENGQCKLCSTRFEYCETCDADTCLTCIDRFIVKDDGLCWENHCAEYRDEWRDFCHSCEIDEDGH